MTTSIPSLWRRRHDDDGFSLTELLVSTAIMAVVMVMVTAGVMQASSTSSRVEAASTAQTQVHQAFDKLDRQVRWASGVSTPATVGGNDYVEYLTTYSGTPTCFELRLDRTKAQLQQRSWVQGATVAGPWSPLASQVTATTPFTTSAGGTTFALARLRVAVTSTAGGARATASATTDVTFTALNSGGGSASSSVCTEGRLLP